MKFEEKATVLTAESKPYEFNGNSGVSHRVRLLIGTEIFAIKSTEKQVLEAKNYVGKDVTVELLITSPRESVKVDLLKIEE